MKEFDFRGEQLGLQDYKIVSSHITEKLISYFAFELGVVTSAFSPCTREAGACESL